MGCSIVRELLESGGLFQRAVALDLDDLGFDITVHPPSASLELDVDLALAYRAERQVLNLGHNIARSKLEDGGQSCQL